MNSSVPPKAEFSILVILFGITVVLHPCINVLVAVSIIALQLLRLSYMVLPLSTTIDVIPSQPENTSLPIVVALLGITINVRVIQLQKAHSSILVKSLSNLITPLPFSYVLLRISVFSILIYSDGIILL